MARPRRAAAALAASALGEGERLIIEAEHASATHERPRALELVRRLLTEEAMAPAAGQTPAIAATLDLVNGPRLGRRERRTFEPILDYAAGHTPGITLAAKLILLLPAVFPPAEAARWRERLRPAVLRRVDRPPVTEELPLEAFVLHRIGETERAQERFRMLGRELQRGAGQPATWHLALKALNLLVPEEDDLDDFPPAFADPLDEDVDPVLAGWVEALGGFLLHRGPGHLARQVESLLRADFSPSPGFQTWVEEDERELGDHEVWDRLLAPDPFGGLGLDFDVHELDDLDVGALAETPLADPRFDPSELSFEELGELLRRAAQALPRGRGRVR